MKKYINVVLTADQNYVKIIDVAMVSILENISKDVITRFFVFSYNFTLENVKKMQNLARQYNCEIINVPMEDYMHIFSEIDVNKFNNKYISIACYFRLLIFGILPSDVKECFFVDSDIIVTCDLSKIKLSNGNLFGAVIEPIAMEYREKILSHCFKLEEFKNFQENPLAFPYFNAGFFLVNLEKTRGLNIYERILELIKKYPELPYADQDILNLVFGQEHYAEIEFFPAEYNMFAEQNYLYQEYNRLPYPYAILQEACKKPLIIHYGGANKPWLNDKIAMYHNIWWEYAKFSQFYLSLFAKYIFNNKVRYFGKKVFNINNEITNNKVRKVYTILGLKIKILNKQKIKA